MTEIEREMKDTLGTVAKDISEIKVNIGKLQVLVNGGPGQSTECRLHRDDISSLKSQLQRYGGALAILIVVLNFVGPYLVKHFLNGVKP